MTTVKYEHLFWNADDPPGYLGWRSRPWPPEIINRFAAFYVSNIDAYCFDPSLSKQEMNQFILLAKQHSLQLTSARQGKKGLALDFPYYWISVAAESDGFCLDGAFERQDECEISQRQEGLMDWGCSAARKQIISMTLKEKNKVSKKDIFLFRSKVRFLYGKTFGISKRFAKLLVTGNYSGFNIRPIHAHQNADNACSDSALAAALVDVSDIEWFQLTMTQETAKPVELEKPIKDEHSCGVCGVELGIEQESFSWKEFDLDFFSKADMQVCNKWKDKGNVVHTSTLPLMFISKQLAEMIFESGITGFSGISAKSDAGFCPVTIKGQL